jgi:hypothetical protein
MWVRLLQADLNQLMRTREHGGREEHKEVRMTWGWWARQQLQVSWVQAAVCPISVWKGMGLCFGSSRIWIALIATPHHRWNTVGKQVLEQGFP